MTIRSEDVNTILGGGGEVRTSSGDKIGKVGQVYLDDETGQPSWVTVKTGLFGTQESFVPLSSADLAGEDVVVPYDKETIKGAPRMESDASLSPQEEKRLYSYYFSATPIAADANRDQDAERALASVPSPMGAPIKTSTMINRAAASRLMTGWATRRARVGSASTS